MNDVGANNRNPVEQRKPQHKQTRVDYMEPELPQQELRIG